MPDDKAAPNWEPKAVLDRLAAKNGPASTVSIQLFLGDQVMADDISRFVEDAMAEETAELGLPRNAVRVGKPFKLARSIGVTAPLPVIEALLSRKEFVGLLPSELSDVMIKPVRRGP